MKRAILHALIAFVVAALGFTIALRFLAHDDVEPELIRTLTLQLSFWLAALPAFLVALVRSRRARRPAAGVGGAGMPPV